MNVKIQIISILISFIFGIFFSIMTTINYKFLFSKNKIFKIVFNIIYVLDMFLIYFLIMKKINYGIVHIYFLIIVGIGFLVGITKFNRHIYKIKYKLKKCLINVKNEKK